MAIVNDYIESHPDLTLTEVSKHLGIPRKWIKYKREEINRRQLLYSSRSPQSMPFIEYEYRAVFQFIIEWKGSSLIRDIALQRLKMLEDKLKY